MAAGESLWSIAHDTLAARLGREPTVEEIDPYWRALVAPNTMVLPHPHQPDLLYVGTDLTLPP